MSSMMSRMPYPTIAAYAASKAFLRSFAQSLNYELRPHGVRVTVVQPGAVDTTFYRLSDKWRRRFIRFGIILPPRTVALAGLKALKRNRTLCTPGVSTHLAMFGARLIPPFAVRLLLRLPSSRS